MCVRVYVYLMTRVERVGVDDSAKACLPGAVVADIAIIRSLGQSGPHFKYNDRHTICFSLRYVSNI
jgi:hypothetical protein